MDDRTSRRPRPDGRLAIIVAAERLIALRGPMVASRDIAVAAGSRNNSAVKYHFETREDLIAAVMELRAAAIEVRRLDLLVEAEQLGLGDDVRALVAACVNPLVEFPLQEDGSLYYARFLEQTRVMQKVHRRASLEAHRSSFLLVQERLRQSMHGLSTSVREQRLHLFGKTMLPALAADHEHQLEFGCDEFTQPLDPEVIIDALTAFLVAGPGVATQTSAQKAVKVSEDGTYDS